MIKKKSNFGSFTEVAFLFIVKISKADELRFYQAKPA